MKYRWLKKTQTKEDIEALTGKKVLRIISGELDTDDPDVKEWGIEIEFDGEVNPTKLEKLDKELGHKFKPHKKVKEE